MRSALVETLMAKCGGKLGAAVLPRGPLTWSSWFAGLSLLWNFLAGPMTRRKPIAAKSSSRWDFVRATSESLIDLTYERQVAMPYWGPAGNLAKPIAAVPRRRPQADSRSLDLAKAAWEPVWVSCFAPLLQVCRSSTQIVDAQCDAPGHLRAHQKRRQVRGHSFPLHQGPG